MAGQYPNLVCGIAQAGGEVEIYHAGHCPAIVGGRNGVVPVESIGLPIGMFMDGEFTATRLMLEAGDTIFLYSNGLSEANCAGDEYGVERVTHFVHQERERQPAELIGACLGELRAYTNGEPLLDDLTLLAVQRCG
jgi:sigma-B regulation protein RsbU (phosphoserine phosphatase)